MGQISKQRFSRRHHYVPKFYLAGFMASATKADLLWVFDKKTNKSWKSKPGNAAFERDFFRADLPGLSPDIFENALSEFESKASGVLKDLIRTVSMPSGESFIILMNLIALMATRIPGFRHAIAEPLSDISKFILKMLVSSPDKFKALVRKMKRNGFNTLENVPYSRVKEFVESDEYEISVSRGWLIRYQLESAGFIVPLLFKRNWTLAFIDNSEFSFITSDRPVVLMWAKPMPRSWSPGFALPDTKLIFPLGKRLVLLGRFEGFSQIVKATMSQVAAINSSIRIFSERYIYSEKRENIFFKKTDDLDKRV